MIESDGTPSGDDHRRTLSWSDVIGHLVLVGARLISSCRFTLQPSKKPSFRTVCADRGSGGENPVSRADLVRCSGIAGQP